MASRRLHLRGRHDCAHPEQGHLEHARCVHCQVDALDGAREVALRPEPEGHGGEEGPCSAPEFMPSGAREDGVDHEHQLAVAERVIGNILCAGLRRVQQRAPSDGRNRTFLGTRASWASLEQLGIRGAPCRLWT